MSFASRFRVPTLLRIALLTLISLFLFGCTSDPTDRSTAPVADILGPIAAAPEDPPQFILGWGSVGSGPGAFNFPTGIDLDSGGNVYVGDYYNQRIQKFTPDGTFLTQWGGGFRPDGVSVDDNDIVYVVDDLNNRVLKFSNTGTLLMQWGASGSGDGEFLGARDVAVTPQYVYVTDEVLNRVQKFSPTGTFLGKWGSTGSGDGEFDGAIGVDVAPNGSVYVTDFLNNRVQEFTADGVFLSVLTDITSNPTDVHVDESGDVLVSSFADRIIKVDDTGKPLTSWNASEVGGVGFLGPQGVVSNAAGEVYVADLNPLIQKFGPADGGGNPGGGGGHRRLPPRPEVDPVIGSIGVYGDPLGSSCELLDDGSDGIRSAYIVHTGTGCKTGSSFSAPFPSCMVGPTLIADVLTQGIAIGSSQSGISVGYGNAFEGPVLVMTIFYTTQHKAKKCCPWEVLPNPQFGELEYTTCDVIIEEEPIPGWYGIVNSKRRCPCVPQSTAFKWRKIRALGDH